MDFSGACDDGVPVTNDILARSCLFGFSLKSTQYLELAYGESQPTESPETGRSRENSLDKLHFSLVPISYI